MPEYSDIYIISSKRDTQTALSFLDSFLPKRMESASEYEIPRFSKNPQRIFNNALELIEYCTEIKNIEHSIYWQSSNDSKPEHAMILYLKDENVIYGLSTNAADQHYAKKLLIEMKKHFGSSLGYIGHEASPDSNNLSEFKKLIEIHKQ